MQSVDQLLRAIEGPRECGAALVQSVAVQLSVDGAPAWDEVVHVFDLQCDPNASGADAWSSAVDGSDNRRFFAVQHMGAITASVEAVRTAMVAEHRRGPNA